MRLRFHHFKLFLFLLSAFGLATLTMAYITQKPQFTNMDAIIPDEPETFHIEVLPLPNTKKSTFKGRGNVLTDEEISSEITFVNQNGLGNYAIPKREYAPRSRKDNVVSWSIQLGSYVDIRRAEDLRLRVLKEKYAAYIEKVPSLNHKYYFRVKIGPEVDRTKIELMKDKVQNDFQVKAYLSANYL